jgi:DNA-binding GntR family transcriptional regulator
LIIANRGKGSDMATAATRGAEIEAFLLGHVEAHPADIAKVTAEHFGISRQAANKHLARLVAEKKLTARGSTKGRTHVPAFHSNKDDDYRFSRTSVPVALARVGDESLVSRSQAKRLLARLDRFEDVLLDFQGVESIGQAFADEIFRVFANEHPGVKLEPLHTSSAVDRMIRRALAHAADDRQASKVVS